MIALYIIVGIIAFLGLLLLLPVSVRIKFDREFGLKAYYSGIKVFDTAKAKSEDHKKDHESQEEELHKESKEKKEIFIVRDFNKMDKIDFIKFYAAVLKDVLKKVSGLLKHIHIKIFDFTLAVGSDDAYDTAMQFGIISAALDPVLLLIFKYTKVKARRVNIYADFVGNEYYFKTDVNFKIALLFILIYGLKLFKIFKELDSGTYKTENEKKKTQDTTQKEESVKTDE